MHTSHSKSSCTRTIYTGKVDFVSPHYAFILVKGLEKDIFVSHNHLQGAMHEDEVKVGVMSKKNRGRLEGKVVDIIKRAHRTLIGRVAQHATHKVVVPDHKRFHQPIILLNTGYKHEAKLNDKVVVQIKKYPSPQAWAQGELSKVFGPSGSHEAEMGAIMEQYSLEYEFSPAIQKAVSSFPNQISSQEIARRRDFTHTSTFTIDPVDAKDFDDALSIKKLPSNHYEVGIHIADVSYYVKPNSKIDKEALKRGTSVYLVGNCIPMLPERLANDLCSLKPCTLRPAFSVVIILNEKGIVQNIWVGETVIYSKKRFSYDEAKKIIQEGKGDFCTELGWLSQLAKKLRKQRLSNGSIAFETTDLNIELDQKGQPVQISPKPVSEANKLIEEFMLLANKLVAEMIYKKKQGKKPPTFVYRVHDKPSPDKLEQFALYLKQLGYSFETTPNELAKNFNNILQTVQNTPHQDIVQTLAIRTMAQACYDIEAKPHFGLGYTHYTHFTSPIRRYPDLVVHRLVKDYLQNKLSPNPAWYEEMTVHASSRERLAIDAERTSISGKQVLFMKKLEGNIYKGIISGITAWGIYVELLENKCEGMVKVSDLKDDKYTLGNRNFCLIGKQSKKIYKLGGLVWVRVKHCDIERRIIDLVFVKS